MAAERDTAIRVLLVEDSPADAALVEARLEDLASGELVLEQVGRLDAAKDRLARGDVDCVLLDLGLPDASGLDGLGGLRSATPVAIVVLTGDSEAATGVSALKAGAQDYLVKGASGAEIARAVRHAVERRRMEAENARSRAILGATTDFVGVADAQGRVLFVNRAGRLLVGIGEFEDISAMTITDFVTPGAADRFATDVLPAAIRDGVWRGETPFRHREGHEIPTSLVVVVEKREDGQVAFFATIARDIRAERAAAQRLRESEARLRQLADQDPLTGLLNRRRMDDELERHAAWTTRYGPQGALLLLDLDRFKEVNDGAGHAVGDSLLVGVGALLLRRLRSSDTLARLGGDEFAVLLPRADLGEAREVAQDLLSTIREQVVVPIGEQRRRVTASIGIAAFGPDPITGEEALRNADLAMYDAKEGGRDRLALYSPQAHPRRAREDEPSWAERIRDGLADDRFCLYAQPIRQARTGDVVRHELLLRLRENGGEPIAPAAFLPTAERLDMVQEIDRWVVARAFELLQGEGAQAAPLHVNVSARSIGDDALLALIEKGLERHGADPAKLTFELTETAALADMQRAREFATRLTELGCRLALDDFGAGFGSFYYLKHLPFDFLKIDGEFVRGCLTSRTDRLVIEAVVGIAGGLGKQTIAEYVGDRETYELLRDRGVDFAQGFHVGRPGPVEEIMKRPDS